MRFIGVHGALFILAGCATHGIQWSERTPETVTVRWVRQAPGDNNAGLFLKTGPASCTIMVPEPKNWLDYEVTCLGHELIHCFGGNHKQPTSCL